MLRITKFFFLLMGLAALAACQQTPPKPGMKLGKPYSVEGNMYYPAYDPSYDKVGEASWYGPGFHGKYTANGEIYNQNDLTAAHPTLPMPCIVRVTNLSSGKSKLVRINDRGPFKSNRIIDLSKKSAEELGIKSLAQVRVQFMPKETEDYIAVMKSTGKGIDMAQMNDGSYHTPQVQVAAAEPPPSNPQIVEQTDSSSHSGQPVNDAAPIMTVSSEPIPGDKPAEKKNFGGKTELYDSSGRPIRGGSIIHAAWADDNATMPEPPKEEAKAETPAPTAEPFNPPPSETAAAEPEPAKEKPVEKAPAAGGKYLIQAGSFSSEENAQKLHSKLLDIATASIDYIEKNGRQWWRVRVGPFADKQEAEAALAQVRAAGSPDAKLVTR